MEEPVAIVIEKTCRTCMTQDISNEYIPLFQSEKSCQLSHPEVLEEVLFFNLGLWENDGLPQQICSSCVDTFTQISAFRKQCDVVQNDLWAYRRLILDVEKKTDEGNRMECLATDSVDNDNDSSVGKDPNEDEIIENLFIEYIQEDCSMDCEENSFGVSKDENLEGGNEEIKEFNDNDVTKEVFVPDLKCNFCNKNFAKPSILLRHIKECPNRNIEICYYCTLECESKEKLEAHTKEMHSDGKFMCFICCGTYSTAATRNYHINKSHAAKNAFECFACNNMFDSANNLKRHVQRVHAIIKKQCPICEKEFNSIFPYQYHMELHNPKKKFQCQYCDKSFMQIHHKANHETVHTRKRLHVCSLCGKSYKHQHQLKMHMSRHGTTEATRAEMKSRRNSYQCNICGKILKKQQTLKTHMITHTDIELIKCDQCDRLWRSKFALQMHKYRVHGEPNTNENNSTGNMRDFPFCCSICSKGFLVAHTLFEHMKIHSEDRKHICKECGSAFKLKSQLKTHISQVHIKLLKFPCDLCEKKFASKGELKGHRVTHYDEKPFKCSSCPLAFKWKNSLRSHERVHTGEKPYSCEICGKRFANSQSLLYHSMFHTDAEKKIAADKIFKKLKSNQKVHEEIKEPIINVDS